MSTDNSDNRITDDDFDLKRRAKSIILSISIDNRNVKMPNGTTTSLYRRLMKYSAHKGLSEQDILRAALSQLLEKVGY